MPSDVNDTDAGAAPEERGGKLRPLLNAAQLLALIPISRTTLFRLERDKLFPQGQAITPHRKLWFEEKVIAWQRDLQNPDSALSEAMRSRVKQQRSV